MSYTMLRVLVAAAGLALVASANAETRILRGQEVGTAHQPGADLNGDGELMTLARSTARSTVGRVTGEGTIELTPWDGVSFCGPTHVLLRYRYLENAYQTADGSAFFGTLNNGTVCFDFATAHYTITLVVDIVGGTGRFEGASGQVAIDAHSDKPFINAFSAFSGTFTGTITTPKCLRRAQSTEARCARCAPSHHSTRGAEARSSCAPRRPDLPRSAVGLFHRTSTAPEAPNASSCRSRVTFVCGHAERVLSLVKTARLETVPGDHPGAPATP